MITRDKHGRVLLTTEQKALLRAIIAKARPATPHSVRRAERPYASGHEVYKQMELEIAAGNIRDLQHGVETITAIYTHRDDSAILEAALIAAAAGQESGYVDAESSSPHLGNRRKGLNREGFDY